MVRFAAAALCLLLAACFNPTFNNPTCGANGECPSGSTCVNGTCMTGGGDDDGGDPDAIDAPPDFDAIDAPTGLDGAGFAVSYLPASASIPGTGDWTVNDSTTLIDTTNLVVMPALPTGVTLTMSMQTMTGAPEVAVLHVNRMQITTGVTLRAVGIRPLVIIAGNEVVLDGTLDVGGAQALPGAGGFSAMEGPGPGQPGQSNSLFMSDGGGGGGGYGTPGARGGDGFNGANGGNGGNMYGAGPPTQLLGGSGGGNGSQNGCPIPRGGGGGGAVLIASATRIAINGGIRAGGGGGMGGTNCGDSPGGGGGGAGGQIDLEAPMYGGIAATVTLAANGGGGGGGGDNAMDGFDGLLSPNPANGGSPGGGSGQTEGGAGAANTSSPVPGGNGNINCGGGGGAVGRITVRYRGTQPTIMTSPPATFVTY